MSLQVLANRYLQFFFFCLFILVLLLGVSFYHLGYWYLRLRSFLWLHNGHLHWFLVPFLVMLLVSQQKTWDVLYRLSFEKLLQMFVSSKEAGCSDILRETPQKKMCASPSCSSSPTVEVSPGTGWLRARQALSHFILSSLKHCLLTPQRRNTARTSWRPQGYIKQPKWCGFASYVWHHVTFTNESMKES